MSLTPTPEGSAAESSEACTASAACGRVSTAPNRAAFLSSWRRVNMEASPDMSIRFAMDGGKGAGAEVELPEHEQVSGQDPMKEDRDRPREPAALRVEGHADDIPRRHGHEVDQAKPAQHPACAGLATDEEARAAPEVPADPALHGEDQHLAGQQPGIGN